VALALALVLLAASALAASAVLRLSWTGTLVTAFLFAFAEIVLIAEVLSPFDAIRARNFLLAETAIAVGALGLWVMQGTPRPRTPRIELSRLRRHPAIIVLGSAVTLALVGELALIVAAVPNNWDSMSYHLSRAAAWYQHGMIGHIPAHTERENAFPPNGEVLSLFTMIFAHTDRFTALPQLVSELALLVAIFGISRRLGFNRSEAAFASLIFATLSEVALQATTTQNDLVVAACTVVAAYFLLGRNRVEIALAGLAIALALGTKLTAVFAGPVLLLLAFALLPRRLIVTFVLAVVVAFAALASPGYARNLRDYGSPFGPPSVLTKWEATRTTSAVAATVGRVLYRFIDFSGVQRQSFSPPERLDASIYVPTVIHGKRRPISYPQSFFLVNGRADEDYSYFGPLGAFLVLPLAFGYLVAWSRSRTVKTKGLLALALPLYLVTLALAYSYNEWIGRFMLVPVGLVAPLLARSYAAHGLRVPITAFGVFFLALAFFHNGHKPLGLGGQDPFWTLTRPEAQALSRPYMATSLEGFDRVVPEHARVGYVLAEDDWDYPLYGEHLKRTLIRLPARDPLRAAAALHLRWVVIGRLNTRGSAGWLAVKFRSSRWSLLTPRSSPSAKRLLDLARM
jgi:Dolichyl-phosphate-mannose-protein mannosyltransferase